MTDLSLLFYWSFEFDATSSVLLFPTGLPLSLVKHPVRRQMSAVASVFLVSLITLWPQREALAQDSSPAPAAVVAQDELGSPQSTQESVAPPNENRLQLLIDAAAPGSRLLVPNGIYTMPISIKKPLTLTGESREGCVLELTSDEPAILVQGEGWVRIESLTIKWQRKTSEERETPPCALLLQDAKAVVDHCHFVALGNNSRCPAGIMAAGFSDLQLTNTQTDGFEFTIQYWGGAQGSVIDCDVLNPGHCGITVGRDAEVTIERTLVTGSDFHGVRCTGGKLLLRDNLITKNKNRGIYLGNRSARGEVINNLIVDNTTGISSFAQSTLAIRNNLISGSTFAGLDLRDTCPLEITANIFHENKTGVIVFEADGTQLATFGTNTFWTNETDTKDVPSPGEMLKVDPAFVNKEMGQFSVAASQLKEQGLTDPQLLQTLWKRWEVVRGR